MDQFFVENMNLGVDRRFWGAFPRYRGFKQKSPTQVINPQELVLMLQFKVV